MEIFPKGFSMVLAKMEDLNCIWEIVKQNVADMHKKGIMHYGPHYPTRGTFKTDIEKEELFLLKNFEEICGLVCLSKTHELPSEYDPTKFTEIRKEKWLFLQRFFLHPKYQKKGLGQKILVFIDQYAISQGRNAIRLEVYFDTVNRKLHGFYENHGFNLIRIASIPGRIFKNFAVFEKVLKQPAAKL